MAEMASPDNTSSTAQEIVMSDELKQKLANAGVFKGFEGLEGLLNARDFWDQQSYGTRLYYGPGITDYLHRDVLRAAVELLKQPAQQQSRGHDPVREVMECNDPVNARATEACACGNPLPPLAEWSMPSCPECVAAAETNDRWEPEGDLGHDERFVRRSEVK